MHGGSGPALAGSPGRHYGSGVIRFSLFGIPIEVHPWFWVLGAFLGGGLYADSKEAIMRMLLFMIAAFVSVLVHELGHALTGRKFGCYSQIQLHGFGGQAAFSGGRFTRPQSFLVTAAGPVVQILLGVVVFVIYINAPDLGPYGSHFLAMLWIISLIWALLNLLPVVPLDGGQMLHAVLGPGRVRITLWVSIITAVVAAVGVYLAFRSFLFPLFLGMFAWQAWKELQGRRFR